ncbi:MAG: phosphatidylserine decarboxylase family protein [candidate division KSB1 bacterium]|nr:phosphatidylserine decarboxylase family protein [candidate division KSB1 bacterium]MDQ7066055.1 phosphatidylserine decarboxylase family protein [candidate division KSB1 bacterium]
MHREGYGPLLAFLLVSVVMTLDSLFWSRSGLVTALAGLGWFLTVFTGYFFRDPDRTIPEETGAIVSPADGRIIEISEVEEPEFLQQKATKVSIFMSVVDVHVNRAPISGTVKYFRYQKGRFLRAYLDEASIENEQTIIGVENGNQRLVFKQIAGLIARRVSCDVREGHKISRGERIGIIKFGSRVDLFFPVGEVELRVQLKEKVKAGESIIGVFKHVS